MIPVPAAAQTKVFTAPVKGLNYKSPPNLQRPGDAAVLDNVICRATHLEVRKGLTAHSIGYLDPIETLIPYVANGGSASLFAAAGDSIYDATASGAVGAAVVTGLTSAVWSFTTVSNIGGNTLLAVNGADPGQSFNGTAWAAWSISGVSSDDLDFVTTWKRRVWAIEKGTFRAWYLPIDAVSGAMTSFEFKAVFQRGGHLVAILNWTVDGGDGADDFFVAISSEGEVAVYAGTDPASAATFAKRGLYYLGKPIGRRFFAQLGGDVILLTQNGIAPLGRVLESSTVNRTNYLSDKLGTLLEDDIRAYGSTAGWEVHVFHQQNLLVLQVPAGGAGTRYQYVMNTETRAWSRLLYPEALTFAVHASSLYLGDSERVANAWAAPTDDGEDIRYRIVPAFDYFDDPMKVKQFHLARLTFRANSAPTYRVKLLTNFNLDVQFPSQVAAQSGASLWGTALWGTALWGGQRRIYQAWRGLSGAGVSGALAIEGVSNDTVTEFLTAEFIFTTGGVVGS